MCLMTQQSEAVNILQGKKDWGTAGMIGWDHLILISFEAMEHK